MTVRRALAVAGMLLVSGCGGGDSAESFSPESVSEADAFVRALVADGDPVAAAGHAAGRASRDLDIWHWHLVRDGVQTVEGPGGQRANCLKAFPVFTPPRPSGCIVYRLRGLKPLPGSARTLVTTARLRVWVARRDDGWRVVDFDYSPRLEAR